MCLGGQGHNPGDWEAFRRKIRPAELFCQIVGISSPNLGGGLKGLVHNLLMQFFTLCSSKIEVFETYFFFDTVIT